MDNRTAIIRLRNVLAELYPDETGARRVVADAGLNAQQISFSNRAIDNWHAILTEVAKNGGLDSLMAVALAEYGQNNELQQAWRAYRPPQRPVAVLAKPSGEIFLSYSHRDRDIMQRLYTDLAGAGFDLWIDDGLEPGTPSWTAAIQTAIEQASCMVVILSPDAKSSQWVNSEISYAQSHHLPIFPVLAKGDVRNAVPFSLITAQRVDFRRNTPRLRHC